MLSCSLGHLWALGPFRFPKERLTVLCFLESVWLYLLFPFSVWFLTSSTVLHGPHLKIFPFTFLKNEPLIFCCSSLITSERNFQPALLFSASLLHFCKGLLQNVLSTPVPELQRSLALTENSPFLGLLGSLLPALLLFNFPYFVGVISFPVTFVLVIYLLK